MNTPETDKAERMAYSQEYMVPTEFARKLERERDELQSQNKKLIEEVNDLIKQRPLLVEDFKKERDEAREKAAKWEAVWEAVALREASIKGARICVKEDVK